MNPFSHTEYSISDSLKAVRKNVLIYETIIDFWVYVSGDSMEPRYHNRELIWIEQTEWLEDGEIGIFYFDGNAYVKKFQNNRRGAYLVSLNKNYPPMPITESSSFKIFGRVLS